MMPETIRWVVGAAIVWVLIAFVGVIYNTFRKKPNSLWFLFDSTVEDFEVMPSQCRNGGTHQMGSGYDTVYLGSGEVIGQRRLLSTIIEIGWGIEKLQSIVAFGSAVRPTESERVKTGRGRFLFWTWDKFETVYHHPKDIDLLIIYDKEVETDQLNETNQAHKTPVQYFTPGNYGGMYHHGVRSSDLHMFRMSKQAFEKKLNDADEFIITIFNEGVVVWGKNDLIMKSESPRTYVNAHWGYVKSALGLKA